MWRTIQIAIRKNGWVQTILDRAERPMIIILHVGILFQIFSLSYGNTIISLSTITLGIIYLLAISLKINQKGASAWSQTLFKAAYLVCAISLFGLFLKSYLSPVYKPLLLIGSVLLLVILINVLIQVYKNPYIKIFDRRAYIRTLAILIVNLVYYFIH